MYITDDDTPSLKRPFMIIYFAVASLLCVLVAIVTGDALFFGGAAICGVMSLMALMAAVCNDNRVERQKMEKDDG